MSLVTSRGQSISTNDTKRPELFAALKGSGGGLGVVTSLTLEAFRVTQVVLFQYWLPFTHCAEIIRLWQETAPDLRPEFGVALDLYSPSNTTVRRPVIVSGQMVITGDSRTFLEEATKFLDMFNRFADETKSDGDRSIRIASYLEAVQYFAEGSRPRWHFLFRSGFASQTLSIQACGSVKKHMEEGETGDSIWFVALGTLSTFLSPSSFPWRDSRYWMAFGSSFDSPSETSSRSAWLIRAYDALKSHLSTCRGIPKSYVNYQNPDLTPEIYPFAYWGESIEGNSSLTNLINMKRMYDPTQIFLSPQPIPSQIPRIVERGLCGFYLT
jgi:hypothetical protein